MQAVSLLGVPHCKVPSASLAWQSLTPGPEERSGTVPKMASILERAETTKGAPRSSFSLPTWSPQQDAPEGAILQVANS